MTLVLNALDWVAKISEKLLHFNRVFSMLRVARRH
jgi:hypothetical protein